MMDYIRFRDLDLKKLSNDKNGYKSFIIRSIELQPWAESMLDERIQVKYTVSSNPFDDDERTNLRFEYITHRTPTQLEFYSEFWEKGVVSVSVLEDVSKTFYIFSFDECSKAFDHWKFLNFLKSELEDLSHAWVVDDLLFVVSPMGADIERLKKC